MDSDKTDLKALPEDDMNPGISESMVEGVSLDDRIIAIMAYVYDNGIATG